MELHITNIVSDQVVKALCNTLVHSLWQGLILAAVTGLTVVLTKKASAALRYNLLISFLLLFAASISFTFFKQLGLAERTNVTMVTGEPVAQNLQMQAGGVAVADNPVNIITGGINYFNTHANMIVMIWFLIICARCVQFGAGLHNVYYLKRSKVLSAGGLWNDRINEMADGLGITRSVSLLQSGIAKVPMVLGHLKPVILVPIGLLAALSAEEVEAILIHELAHIRRRDYLVNLGQNLMEIVFFFNPAVLWVSTLIRTERENCCDDIVVAHTSSKVGYIQALVSCQEYQMDSPALAMGLGGKQGHFVQRVKRMLSNNNQTLNKMEKMVLTVCLISAVVISSAFSKIAEKKKEVTPKHQVSASKNSVSTAKTITTTDSVPIKTPVKNDTTQVGELKVYKPSEVANGSTLKFSKRIHGKVYVTYLIKENDTLYQLMGPADNSSKTYYVNGRVIQGNDMAKYRPTFARIISEIDNQPSPLAVLGTLQHNGGTGEIVDDADVKDKLTNDIALKADAEMNNEVALVKPKGLKLSEKVAFDSIKQAKFALKGSKVAIKPLVSHIQAYKMAHLDSLHQGYTKIPATAYKPVPPAYQPYNKVYGAQAVTAPKTENFGEEIANDLIELNLIKNKANYSFKISNDALYVDGVKQPEAIHKQILDKYVKPGDKIDYSRTNTTN